jgi:hypothetical protein
MPETTDQPFEFNRYADRSPWDRLPLLLEQWRRLAAPYEEKNRPGSYTVPKGLEPLTDWMTQTRRQIDFVERGAARYRYMIWRRWWN